ncbi:MAG: hypothetical protein ACLTXT_03080, partial [Ruminococcus callidus]
MGLHVDGYGHRQTLRCTGKSHGIQYILFLCRRYSMKFSDGLWLNQRGFDVSYAVQAYDVTTTKNSIKIFATSSAIWNRAMTLG